MHNSNEREGTKGGWKLFQNPVPQLRYWGTSPRTEFEVLRRHYKKSAQRNEETTMAGATNPPQGGSTQRNQGQDPPPPPPTDPPPPQPPKTPPGQNRNRSNSAPTSPSNGNGGPPKKKTGVVGQDGTLTQEVTQNGDEGYKDSSGKEHENGPQGMQGVQPRNTRKLPKPVIKKPFTLPDLATVPPDPSAARNLPLRIMTVPQLRPVTSTETYIHPLQGPFRSLKPPPKWLMQNVNKEHMVEILSNPDKFLAVIFFGAGARLFKESKMFIKAAVDWIESLGFGDKVSLNKVAEKDTTKPDENPFQPPYICILSKFGPELRDHLTKHQTFIISQNLAFHVLRFDPQAAPWTLTRLQGTMVSDNNEDKQQARAALIKRLFKEPEYRRFILERAKNSRGHLSDDELVYTSLSSFELHYVHDVDNHGEESPYYLVTAMPIFYHLEPEVHNQWVKIVESPKFYTCTETLARYTPYKKPFKMCNLCKFDDCHEDRCYITMMEGYDGPRLSATQTQTIEESNEMHPAFAAIIPEEPSRGTYRDWNGGSRGRGYRGASHGHRGAAHGHRGLMPGQGAGFRGRGRGRGGQNQLYYEQ
ncbi:hypothetical protein PM082_011131 [Marasmius tenuissimus]|nr:hypothetical protein PM082_011131 [Marasmius tenuissimus]